MPHLLSRQPEPQPKEHFKTTPLLSTAPLPLRSQSIEKKREEFLPLRMLHHIS